MVKSVPLSKGKVALVDDEDYDRVMQYRWRAHFDKRNNLWYAFPCSNAMRQRVGNSMHQFIVGKCDAPIDHINGNGLDNTRINLRACTPTQNAANRSCNKNNTSGFKGVFRSSKNRWRAQIKVSNRAIHLGSYKTPIDAALAYNDAAMAYFGEFAFLNKAPGGE